MALKPVSKPALSQALTHALTMAVAYFAVSKGLHINPTESAGIAWLASTLGGLGAGWISRAEAELAGPAPVAPTATTAPSVPIVADALPPGVALETSADLAGS